MEFEKKEKNPNPWETANFFSRLFYWWIIPLFKKGTKGNLKLSDIYDCPDIDSSEKNGEIMQKEWDRELEKYKNGKHPSLIKATIRGFGLKGCLYALLAFLNVCVINTVQPVLLGCLISHFSRKKVLSPTDLSLVTAGICLMSIVLVITHHTYFFGAWRMGMRIRIACCTIIYRKALKLSQAALSRTAVGQMVNLLSNDVNRFDNSVLYLPFFIIGPIHGIIIVYVLWTYIGYASLASVFVLLLYIFFQTIVGKLSSKFRLKTAGLTDHRIRLMNEIVAGMRIIKMYGWELPYEKLMDLSRRKEVEVIRQAVALRGINIAIRYASSKISLLATFAVFIFCTDGAFTPENVFVTMALLVNLRQSMARLFYYSISLGAECMVSLRRIQKFLLLEEQSETSLVDASDLTNIHKCGIWVDNIGASWNRDNQATLREVTLSVKSGELLAVVGPVGSGKTSLLMSILAELPITSGNIKVRGKVAYVSQEPWVFSGTIRENIVFGRDFDEIKLKKILNICTLDKDMETFPHGNETLVGERGVYLSGGQKARVDLARAMYFDADIFLLDDPLSAVDSAVSKHLFEKCINGYLKDKVRILVTHQIQFLKSASHILVLKEGGCLALGTYEQLVKDGVDLGSLDKKQRLDELAEDVIPLSPHESTHSINPCVDGYNEGNRAAVTLKNVPKMCEESKSSGSVKKKVYTEYIKTGASPLLRVIVLFSFISCQVLLNSTDLWLAGWTRLEQRKYNVKDCWLGVNKTSLNQTGLYNDTNGIFDRNSFRDTFGNVSDDCFILTENYLIDEFDADQQANRMFNLSVYGGLVASAFLLAFIRSIAFFKMCRNASIALHNKMFKSIMRSPIAFFDSNPVGRVLNRFAKDVGAIDETLIIALFDSFSEFCLCCGIISVVAIIQPWFLLPTAIITAIMVLLRRLYLPTARDMKRYEGITRSPVFSHLSTSMHGLTTIRAFKVQTPFEIAFDHYQDQHTATFFLYMVAMRGFGMALEWLCVTYSICVTIAMVVFFNDTSYASKAGLAIACTFELGLHLQWGMRQSAEAESQMTSVERVVEYSNLKPEAALEIEHDKQPPRNWPSTGFIVYNNVSLRYSPNEPPVLKNLSFEIYPKEKIGIVGRTGAGKSSIIATLFRMTEHEGVVKIDGIDTKGVGLHDLRKKISIIPQDPILFTGPLRRNLDPFSKHRDDDLWQALEEAHLKHAIQEMPGGLDIEVAEGGANFSVGQKQLICLARALLRRNKILVLDEATANVDPNTDRLIQQTIRDRFCFCTVVTIAHRLRTIMDSDRVLVLDASEVKEFDSPFNLLQDPRSLFSQMVRMTGPGMAQQLLEVAHSAFLKDGVKKEGSINVFTEAGENDANNMNDTAPYFSEGHVNEGFKQIDVRQ